jgi:hypothetical protein
VPLAAASGTYATTRSLRYQDTVDLVGRVQTAVQQSARAVKAAIKEVIR